MGEFGEIISALKPSAGGLGWSIALYSLFFFNFILLMIEGTSFGTNIGIAILLALFIDKTFAFGHMFNPSGMDPQLCHSEVFFGTYLIRVVMFAGPFAIAGATDNGKARALAIATGLGGMAYMFGRWFLEQRESEVSGVTCMVPEVLIQNAGMLLIIARITLRNRFCLGTVNRRIPITVAGQFATHEIEI